MRIKPILSTVLILLVGLGLSAHAATWRLDKSHSEVGFSVKHMLIATVNGVFGEFDGTVAFDPEDLASSYIKGVVKVASIDTKNERRDNHLRSDDFFNAEQYPNITFESTEIKKSENGFIAVGNLTIRDVTKQIEIPFTLAGPIQDPWGGTRVAIDGSTTINRQEYNVRWNNKMDNGGAIVSDDVVLNLHAELIKE